MPSGSRGAVSTTSGLPHGQRCATPRRPRGGAAELGGDRGQVGGVGRARSRPGRLRGLVRGRRPAVERLVPQASRRRRPGCASRAGRPAVGGSAHAVGPRCVVGVEHDVRRLARHHEVQPLPGLRLDVRRVVPAGSARCSARRSWPTRVSRCSRRLLTLASTAASMVEPRSRARASTAARPVRRAAGLAAARRGADPERRGIGAHAGRVPASGASGARPRSVRARPSVGADVGRRAPRAGLSPEAREGRGPA